jgi:thioredoxin-related protein
MALLACNNSTAKEFIQWQSFQEGLPLSETTGKKVFLYFYTDRCTYCRDMASKTFQDKAVISYLNEHYIPVKVNAAKEPNISKQYQVQGVPATWFITETGEKLRNRPGYIAPKELLQMLKYVATDQYKTQP